MDQATVVAAMQRLEAQGKAPSLGNLRRELGKGSWRDITRLKRAILGNGATQEEESRLQVDRGDAAPAPGRVAELERLELEARDADATLIRLIRERDVQQQVAQAAAMALHQARREAQRLTAAARQAARVATHSPPQLQPDAWARVEQLHAQLAALVGEADAQRVVSDGQYLPSWLRAR